MALEPFDTRDSRTLLVDPSTAHGGKLVEQLNRAGFRTDFAVSWSAARAALAANYYHSCVVIADLNQPTDLEQLDALRRSAMRVWIILLSDMPLESSLALAHRHGLDAVLPAPCSIQDLGSRLAAFCLRARPTF